MEHLPKVLVLDDDPSTLKLLEVLLRREGLDPVVCGDSGTVLDLVQETDPCALILDVLMPGVSGLEILRELRRDPVTRALPILVLSGKGSGADRVRGLRAGADDYLTKPFDPEELLLRLRRLLHGGREGTGEILAGELGKFSAGDVLQQVLMSGLDGVLELAGPPRGRIAVRGGVIVSVRCGALQGRSALIVLLDRRQGRFRFLEGAEALAGTREEEVGLQGTLMELAWLEDELERRREFLPAPDASLELIAEGSPPEGEFDRVEEVLAWLRGNPGATLEALEVSGRMAPQEARLAVAILAEEGLLRGAEEPAGVTRPPGPGATSARIEAVCAHLAILSAEGNRPASVLHVLAVTVASRWEAFREEILDGIPEDLLEQPREAVAAELDEHASVTLRIPSGGATLLVHVHRLAGLSSLRARAFLPLSTGVFLALSGTRDPEEESLIHEVARIRRPLAAVAVPPEDGPMPPDALHPPWRMAPRIPTSFEELLELFLPE